MKPKIILCLLLISITVFVNAKEPLLSFDELLVLKRRCGQDGLPVNHMSNAGLRKTGYENELAVFSPVSPQGKLRTLFCPKDSSYVGEMDLHFEGDRLLFTMPAGGQWNVHEIRLDGSGLRQVTRMPAGVDSFDACYLPDGRIIFASTANRTAVPCWHGRQTACSLYSMDAQGASVRQLTYDQDVSIHPCVLSDGRILYSRWDYTGIHHAYVRPLMTMNPDGSQQRAVYGSNSYWPNAQYFTRELPGSPLRLISIISGYHGTNRSGELVLFDARKRYDGSNGSYTENTR
jgi:hypothetical protein